MMKRANAMTLLALAAGTLLLAGCGQQHTPADDESAAAAATEDDGLAVESGGELPFAGTTWQLVAIQSMDDSVTEPDDRGKYTITFEPGGEVAVVADCNRGRGAWTSEGASQVQMGPMALTRAMCPPGSIADEFVAQLQYVRSYVMQDGNLHLATMADGAIIEFEPAP